MCFILVTAKEGRLLRIFVIWCHLFPFFNSFILPLWSILLSRFGRRRRANLRTRLTLKILQRGCFCMRSVIMEILFLIFRLFWPYFVHHNSFLDVRYTIFIQSQWTRSSAYWVETNGRAVQYARNTVARWALAFFRVVVVKYEGGVGALPGSKVPGPQVLRNASLSIIRQRNCLKFGM